MSVVMTTPVLVVLESCNCFRHFLPFLLNCFVCFDFVPYTSHHRSFAGEGTSEASILERTVAIIKPDAIQNQNEIEAIMIRSGFNILRQRRILLAPEEAGSFYAEHFEKAFFPNLIDYMSSGSVIVYILARQNAISIWRDLIGPTNSTTARVTHPNSLRAVYGTDEQRNGFHGSSDYKSAEREIRFFFREKGILVPIKLKHAAQDYLAKTVKPTLLKRLTDHCRSKPHDPVIWLADWLLEDNQYKL